MNTQTTRNSITGLALIALASTANAAGTIPLSLSQQFDTQGNPLSGCLLYSYQVGTTTPQNAFSDQGLTLALPWPMQCDASGRLPQFFYADGSIKVRLTDSNGVSVLAADNILVIGPSSGGGGGSPVDPSTVYQTGDLKQRYGTGAHSGWVRANGRTIGSASSGGTERANSDCQALFEYLWANDSTLTVSGGRGASANADWLANKTIVLPDWRGTVIAGLDDMGNSAAGRLTNTSSGFGASGTTLGVFGGNQSKTIAQANLPNVNFAIAAGQGVHQHTTSTFYTGASSQAVQVGGAPGNQAAVPVNTSGTTDVSSLPAMTAASGGSGTALSAVQPTRLATIYIKL